MPLGGAQRIPVATYRIQLRKEFPFERAELMLGYWKEMGISDCYCSPILLSAPGSQHGYDVNDYRRIDAELGGVQGFRDFADRARSLGMGILVDFVPNHMGIEGPFNPWWRDVLECGRHSAYARFFDIYWNEPNSLDRARVLVPVLDDHYGRILEQGGLKLVYDADGFAVTRGGMRFPLRPLSQARMLRQAATGLAAALSGELESIAEALSSLPDAGRDAGRAKERSTHLSETKQRLRALSSREPEVAARVAACLVKVNGKQGDPHSFDGLDEILCEQHYRLVRWQAGAHGTNYRRFFAVDSMVGIRVEIPEVFQEAHALISQLVSEGRITGIRIDHIDGLWDPQQYLERLQQIGRSPERSAGQPLYVVVEKILASSESLPESWPVQGTTGYEFIPELARLFVDAAAEAPFDQIYARFTARTAAYADVVYSKKRLVIEELFAYALENMAATLADLVRADRQWCDWSGHELAMAARELMANLGVYRTYRRAGEGMRLADRREIERACEGAIRRNPRLDPKPFQFVRDLLTGAVRPAGGGALAAERLGEWVLTFQQYTGAIMAKAVEDTTYYTYNRLIALNEVGGDPSIFGGTIDEFHAANDRRRTECPHGLLATSTHDTKLSEDVRARLYALSEIPGDWEGWIIEWRELNRRHKTSVDGRCAPDENEEYRLYQILLGAWPADDRIDDTFRERIRQYLRKAVSEAKENTTWHHPNAGWLDACDAFVNAILDEEAAADFLRAFRPQAHRLARIGMVNSLAQVVLKITSPGVPDFYQGNEVFDFSLVDPDNRRPVDYEACERLLGNLGSRPVREALRNWRDGDIKLRVTQALLAFRRGAPELFQAGEYHPLKTEGRFAKHVVAFARTHGEESLIVIVPRLTARLGTPPLGLVWDDTAVNLETPGRTWIDVVTGRPWAGGETVLLADALAELPFLVAASKGGEGSGRQDGAAVVATKALRPVSQAL